ncbi:MAG: ArsR family transcriptional regulator [Natronomonas sp.]
MDSAALLDILGNENRRRILRLLAKRPCYVTEISEYLGVSPKAVIDHLQRLEEAGLVESQVDDRRRKYFSIARNLRLEVNVSPYDFGTKSAYSASSTLDITACRYLSLHVDEITDLIENPATETAEDVTDDIDGPGASGGPEDSEVGSDPDPSNGDLTALATDLERLQRLENELSMAQRWVQGRLTETLDRISSQFDDVDGRFYAELLRGLANGSTSVTELSRRVDAPPEIVRDALEGLAAHDVVEHDGDDWQITETAKN